ncbi:MAG: hypothetical protein ABIS43_18875 [Opitutus sp.]
MRLHHFIKPKFLAALLECRAFHLIRQDQQKSDPQDGVLPPANFEAPHHGELEQMLGAQPAFLVSQARAIADDRIRTFIMSWTTDPNDAMRKTYGESGQRCELCSTVLDLKQMLGYEWLQGNEFPPRPRAVAEISGAIGAPELKQPHYTDGKRAMPVVPSAFATAHKALAFAGESEVRIEAILRPYDLQVRPEEILIRWPARTFAGLSVVLGAKITPEAAERISQLADSLGIPVQAAASPLTH